VIRAQVQQQGFEIERMCTLAGVSRAGYYRHWLASKPREEETALRDEIQRLSLAQRKNGYRHNGYRQIRVLLHRAGWAVNHKRMARIRREDNLLCVPKLSFRPATTDSRHGWRVWPNLARHLVPMAINQLWVADITYIRCWKSSFIWLLSWMRSAGAWWVGRWRSICGPSWRWLRWTWPLAIVTSRQVRWCITRIRAYNMLAAITLPVLNGLAFSLR
jgi:hypothetical protein